MSLLEIILLVFGFIAFVVSFFIPDKGENLDDEGLTRDEIREIIKEEYEASKGQIESITDETVNYGVEKAERSLDKLTNEKIMALGEYSDTVMNQINSNHQETVFLHDMLNSNKNDLTVMLSQAMNDSKEALTNAQKAVEISKSALESAYEANNNARLASDNAVIAESKMINARKTINGDLDDNSYQEVMDMTVDTEKIDEETKVSASRKKTTDKTKQKTKRKSTKTTKQVDYGQEEIIIDNDGQISLNFDAEENSINNNAKILKLHKKGKSNVAIAKELGLGVGEVNLVIALFDKK